MTAEKEDTVRLKKAGKYKFYRELENHCTGTLYREQNVSFLFFSKNIF